jgi:hypothetical protein
MESEMAAMAKARASCFFENLSNFGIDVRAPPGWLLWSSLPLE